MSLSEPKIAVDTRKPAYATHLALRFYVRDGWTAHELNGLCDIGGVEIAHPHDEHLYYTLRHGTYMNRERLDAAVSEFMPTFEWREPREHYLADYYTRWGA